MAPAGPVGTEDALTAASAGTLFGRRVELFGLGQADMNGKKGRCGAWDPAKGRYNVSLGGVSVAPSTRVLNPTRSLPALELLKWY